jgi:DNA processing protein
MSTITAACWHALNLINDENPWKFLRISPLIGGVKGFFRLNENQLLEAGLDPSSTTKIISKLKHIDPEKEWIKLEKLGIHALTHDDSEYPELLRQIPSSPPIIYTRGKHKILQEKSVAVVGSRKISSYGKQAVSVFVPQLVQAGVVIVSGMAAGVDTAALESCLEYGGTPIAVLPTSLDYREIPHSQKDLANKIEEIGCLVSENPPGRIVQKWHFPLRNRLISGLSLGVIIIEGARKSGSMVTANLAIDQNREVFAVPGSIFSSNSEGTLSLIKKGAKCLTEFKDISTEFGWDIRAAKKMKVSKIADPLQQALCNVLMRSPSTLDELITRSKKPAREVLMALTELELAGILKQSQSGIYAKIK